LRAALEEANALTSCVPLTINFSVMEAINLGSALPAISHPNLTINGPGANLLRVNGGVGFRVFDLSGNIITNISGLTLANGDITSQPGAAGDGGIIRVISATLTLTNCAVLNGRANEAGGIQVKPGNLTLNGCTFAGNIGSTPGGALTIFPPANINITNSSFSGNQGNAGGAAAFGPDVNVTITNSTFTGNTATDGFGGIQAFGTTSPTLKNTLVAGNSGIDPDINRFTSAGNNLIGNNTNTTINSQMSSDLVGTGAMPLDPLLAPLGNYGGTTPTHRPLPGSPAIDQGAAGVTTDQRGQSRPYDIPGVTNAAGGNSSDIGAFEVQCAAITLAGLPGGVVGVRYKPGNLASGGTAPYTLSVTAGSLPTGVTVNGNGLPGTPTQTGTFSFTLLASDAYGCQNSQSYVVSIVCPTITLAPATLPNGVQGMAYSQSLTASPAGGNYSYAVTTNVLPPGLTLNAATGALTGTPTVAGTSSFRLTATGTGGCTGSRNYVVSVTCGTLAFSPAGPALPNGVKGAIYTPVQLAVTPGRATRLACNWAVCHRVTR
jgi:large repetitive protein